MTLITEREDDEGFTNWNGWSPCAGRWCPEHGWSSTGTVLDECLPGHADARKDIEVPRM